MRNLRHRLGRSLALIIVAVCVVLTAPLALGAESPAPPADAFPPEQIEQLVAPIALYPDALIARILTPMTR